MDFFAGIHNLEAAPVAGLEGLLAEFPLGNHLRLFLGDQFQAVQVVVDVFGNFPTATDRVGQQAGLDGVAESENTGSLFSLPAIVHIHHAAGREPFAGHVGQVRALADGDDHSIGLDEASVFGV